MSPWSFWPPLQAAQVDYEKLRAHACEHAQLPESLAEAGSTVAGWPG